MKRLTSLFLALTLIFTAAVNNISLYAATSDDLPSEIYLGGQNLVDGTEHTYWKVEGNDTVVSCSAAEYTIMYDGNGTLVLDNLTYVGQGYVSPEDSQTSGALTVHGNDKALKIVFRGENHIESTGGGSYFRQGIRGEGTSFTLEGDEGATLTVESGPDAGPGYTSAFIAKGITLESGTLNCIGTKDYCSGVYLMNGVLSINGGHFTAVGANRAVTLDRGATMVSDYDITASTSIDGSAPVAYDAGSHNSYKYIDIEEVVPVNAPDAIWVGGVTPVDVTAAGNSYWKMNDTGDGITEATADNYTLAYDGRGTLTLNNFNYTGVGYSAPGDSQTSGLITVWGADKELTIVFKGENHIESTGGGGYFRQGIRGEGTSYTFVGDEDARLELVSGPGGAVSNTAGIIAKSITLESGTLACYGTKNSYCNGVYLMNGVLSINGGHFTAVGANRAVTLDRGATMVSDYDITASTSIDGSDPVAYDAGSHNSYKYIDIETAAPANAPDAIWIGDVNVVDAKRTTYWRCDGAAITPAGEDDYNVKYDGYGNLELKDFSCYDGVGCDISITGKYDANIANSFITVCGDNKKLNIVLNGGNYIYNTVGYEDGCPHYAIWAEGTELTFTGANDSSYTNGLRMRVLYPSHIQTKYEEAFVLAKGMSLDNCIIICDCSYDNLAYLSENGVICISEPLKASENAVFAAMGTKQALKFYGDNGFEYASTAIALESIENLDSIDYDWIYYKKSDNDKYSVVEVGEYWDYVMGDADANRTVTANDAAMVLQKALSSSSITLGLEECTDNWFYYVDVNADKIITAQDAAYILQMTLSRNDMLK